MLLHAPIETPRLLLRPILEADHEDIYALDTDPEIMRYIGDGQAMTWGHEESLAALRTVVARCAKWEYGWLAVVNKQVGRFVGTVGLQPDAALGGVELAYKTVRCEWGKGYATEAGRALLTYAFETLGLPRVLSCIQEGNDASARVAEKLGMQHIRSYRHERTGRIVRIYAVERPGAQANP